MIKKRLFQKALAIMCAVCCIAGSTLPASAKSNNTSASYLTGDGYSVKIKTCVDVGRTGNCISTLGFYHRYFSANADSYVTTEAKIKNHTISLNLRKQGVQGTLSCSTSGVGYSATLNTSNMSTFVTPASTSKTLHLKTSNNRVDYSAMENAVQLTLGPFGVVTGFFSIKGTASTQFTIGGSTYVNSTYVWQYW